MADRLREIYAQELEGLAAQVRAAEIVVCSLPDAMLRRVLSDTLGKTGYAFLASRISQEPNFGAVMLDAMRQAYGLGANSTIKI